MTENPQPERMTRHERAFRRFHEANPQVYELFKRFTFEVMAAGHRNLSARMIFDRIRWETTINTREYAINPDTGKPLKIGNNHSPYYARLFMREYPEHDGFFRTRAVGVRETRYHDRNEDVGAHPC